MNNTEYSIDNTLPSVIHQDGKDYVPLHTTMTVWDEGAKTIYHVNSIFTEDAPELGTVLETITLEQAERSA